METVPATCPICLSEDVTIARDVLHREHERVIMDPVREVAIGTGAVVEDEVVDAGDYYAELRCEDCGAEDDEAEFLLSPEPDCDCCQVNPCQCFDPPEAS